MTYRKLALSVVLLCSAALAGATAWQARAREAAAEAAYPPAGQFVTVAGRRVHALVRGSGPDLVLIHGASGSLRDFSFDLIDQLAQDFRVIALDRPGFGWSEPLSDAPDLQAQARHLRAAATLLGAERPIVLGHSYGGAVALAWATDAPDSLAALVPVSAPSHSWSTGLPWLYKLTAPLPGQALLVPLITAWTPKSLLISEVSAVFDPNHMPQGYVHHFGPEMTLRRVTMRANARQRAALKAEIEEMIPRYPSLKLPVEIVHGTDDTTVGLSIHSEPLVRALPDAHLTRLKGVGHMPHHAAPHEVIAAVRRAHARAALASDAP